MIYLFCVSDELYGDFEDLETGEKFTANDKRASADDEDEGSDREEEDISQGSLN